MEYQEAVERYVQGLVDLATILNIHHEARTEFGVGFLTRSIQDGFLQPISDQDRERLLERHQDDENFLIWNGEAPRKKLNWNAVAWIFPFREIDEMERAYEVVTRAALAQKSWAAARQFLLTCRCKLQEAPIQIPTNIVKIRVKGEAYSAAMRCLDHSPPNLRYVARSVVDRLPPSNYFRQRTNIQIVIGERLEPSVRPLTQQRSLL